MVGCGIGYAVRSARAQAERGQYVTHVRESLQSFAAKISTEVANYGAGIRDAIDAAEMERIGVYADCYATVEHSVTAHVAERYGITLTGSDWNRILVERAIPIMSAKRRAYAITQTTSHRPEA